MKEISIEESKQIQLRILQSIDSFCRKNGIHYSLAGGTMIGAVRHKGFIPWDDDIDLMMLRKDYEVFLSTYSDNYYKLLSSRGSKDWPFMYSSVSDPNTVLFYGDRKNDDRGIWVSIFPVDNVDENKIPGMMRRLKFYENYVYRLKSSYWTSNTNLVYNIVKSLGRLSLKPFPFSYWIKRLDALSMSTARTGLLGSPSVWAFDKVFYYSERLFDGFVDLEFEKMQCLAISGYDEYLRSEFGDYMVLPPEEQRIPKHGYKAYWK